MLAIVAERVAQGEIGQARARILGQCLLQQRRCFTVVLYHQVVNPGTVPAEPVFAIGIYTLN